MFLISSVTIAAHVKDRCVDVSNGRKQNHTIYDLTIIFQGDDHPRDDFMNVNHRIISAAALVAVLLLGVIPVSGAQAEPMEGTWDGGQALQMSMNNGYDPWVAQSSNGNRMVVWVEEDAAPNNFVCFSMYTPETGWSWPETLAGLGVGNRISNPMVGMSDNGSAVVSWAGSSWEDHIYSRTYIPGIGWSEVFDHGQTESLFWREYKLMVNGQGDALIAHRFVNSTSHGIAVWTYEAGAGWNEDPDIMGAVPLSDTLYSLNAVLSDAGRAAVIWQHIDSETRVMVSTRNLTGIWVPPAEIDDNDMMDYSLRVGIADSTGEFMVTYRKTVLPDIITYYSITESGVWSTPAPIAGVTSVECWNQNMVMNQGGTALVVTTEYADPSWNVNATMLIDGEWTSPVSIETDLGGLMYPEAAIDELGRAAVSFATVEGRVVYTYTPGEGWTEPALVDGNAIGDTYTTAWLSLESGSILVGYTSYVGVGTVWASVFEAPDTEPPALEVDQALSGETDRPLYEITGTTEPGATVDVNGKPVHVSESGGFSILVELSAGANMLVVTSIDGAGNSVHRTVAITYNDPLPEMEEQMGDQQDLIDQLQDDLDAANDDISGAESTAMMFGIIGVVGLIVAIVALVMVFLRRKG